jgi:hypothetical protein
MALKIDASNLLTRRYLKLKRDGVELYGASIWGTRRFLFADISCALMSADHQLSFQVGDEVFSIQSRPAKPEHQAAIAAMVEGLERSRAATNSALHYSSPP